VGVVNEAIEDGVGIGRVADKGVPFVDGDLAGEDSRTAPVSVLEDLVKVMTGAGVERFEAPIVEDEELDAGESAQDAGIAAVTAGESEFGEELGNPLIENRAVVAAGLVSQGTSKPRFAHAGRQLGLAPPLEETAPDCDRFGLDARERRRPRQPEDPPRG
jgi:hypothetical protein